MSIPDTTDSPAVVVVGVDGSANSRPALAWAAEEAVHRSCELQVLNAWTLPTPTTGGRTGPPSYLPDTSTYQQHAQDLVEQQVRAVLGEASTAVVRAVRGRTVEVLLEAGRSARMVVIGARGSSGLRRGSVSGQLVRRAPCPVLVVPAERQRVPPDSHSSGDTDSTHSTTNG